LRLRVESKIKKAKKEAVEICTQHALHNILFDCPNYNALICECQPENRRGGFLFWKKWGSIVLRFKQKYGICKSSRNGYKNDWRRKTSCGNTSGMVRNAHYYCHGKAFLKKQP